MESSQTNQIVPRKKTFWKMVKTLFIPAQTIAKLMVGCGGKSGKVKRRLSMRNMQQAKQAFMQASFQGAINRSNSRQTRRGNNSIPHEIESESIQQHESMTNEQSSSTLPLPAPLNIEEAEVLLESLNLCTQSLENSNYNSQHDTSQNVTNFELVEVEIVCEDELSEGNLTLTIPPRNEANNIEEHHSLVEDETVESSIEVYENVDENDNDGHPSRRTSFSTQNSSAASNPQANLPRSKTTPSFSSSRDTNDFDGWRKSSIEVTPNPPVTLAFIPSGLCVGDRVVWVKDDHPEIATVRWIGKIRQQFYAGIEFDKPVGNSSGIYGYGVGTYKRLFTCQLSYGRFVPVKELVLYKDYHDSGVRSGIVCVICRDDFLDTWEPDTLMQRKGETGCGDDMQPFNMVSTKCGHLYHWGCLDHWFSSKKRSEFHCPLCSRPMMDRNEVIRIFPSQL